MPSVPIVPGADAPLPTLPAFLEDEEDWPDDGAGVDLDKLLEDDWDDLGGFALRHLVVGHFEIRSFRHGA